MPRAAGRVPHKRVVPLRAPGGFSLRLCRPLPLALRRLLGFGQCEAAAGVRGGRREQRTVHFCFCLCRATAPRRGLSRRHPLRFWYFLCPFVLPGSPLVLISGCPLPLSDSPSPVNRPIVNSPQLPLEDAICFLPGPGPIQTGRMGRQLPRPRLVQRSWLPGPTAVLPSRCFRQPGPSVCQACAEPPSALFIYLLNNTQAQFPFVFNVSAFQWIRTSRLRFC